MKKCKVSIIMPVYNTEKYVADAIDSVCKQNMDGVELIIINDGSTDKSPLIIQEKMKNYDNIIYVSEENMGLSYARKTGLNHANGEYIYFMDSDDLLLDGSLEYMYNEATKNDLDCLMINAVFKNELDNEYGYRMDKKNVVSKMNSSEIVSGEELLKKMIKNREWRYAVWLYFIKREALKNVTFFEKFFHEDSAFNYELLSNTKKVKFTDKDVYIYRLRENSLMSKKQSINNILGYINSFLIICRQNDKKDISYQKYLFEIRILDQIIEVYNNLDEAEKELARKEFDKIIPVLASRKYYYIDMYRDFFTQINHFDRDKEQVLDYIEYLEVDIVDHCNLNCKNCMHFSPLANDGFMDINKFECDLSRLSSLINGRLNSLVIMGGEPLLHKDINRFIEIAAKYFPHTSIQILTNGILLDKMPDSFWDTCKKYNVQINITPYPINVDYYHLYDKVLSHGVDMFIYDNGTVVNKEFMSMEFDKAKSRNALKNFKNCWMAKNCANLKNGKIYICPIINNIDRYNQYYGTNFEVLNTDFIDIYEISCAEDIYTYLSKAAEFCKYCCLDEVKKVKWERFMK